MLDTTQKAIKIEHDWFSMKRIMREIRKELKENSDDRTRETGRRYFREEVFLYGVKTPVVRKIGKKFFNDIIGRPKDEIFTLCTDLWRSGFMEEAFIACQWSYNLRKKYTPDDFQVFKSWLSGYVSNWATCDTLCNHTVGAFLEMYPEYTVSLKELAVSSNRWARRGAAVSLILPARRGRFLAEVFDIADILLHDEDDLVQKGYGWMLKAASETRQAEVYEYVLRNRSVMPRTALRYAVEKMPDAMRNRAMKKETGI